MVLPCLPVPLGAQTVSEVFHRHHSFVGSGPAAGIGDVNGDGFDDVILGLPENSSLGRTAAGSAFVYSGRTGTRLWWIHGAAENDSLGSSVASAGDVNQDGFPDVIVGALGADPGGRTGAGSVFVYSGRNGEQLWQFDGAASADDFGFSISGAGDVNADGFADVIVSAPGADPGGGGG